MDDTADLVLDDTVPASQSDTPNTPPGFATPADERDGFPTALRSRFITIDLVGEGGMGTVYRAHDVTIGRDVAIKILKNGNPVQTPRLLLEARAQARIEDPNVCRVYEVGEAGGVPYLVMQLIEGRSLDQVREDLTIAQRITIIRDIARAVHAAHVLGILHGDIKPANILVRAEPNGALTPFLVDFGIARELRADIDTAGQSIGTPAYMAPEQVTGAMPVSPKADVYGLGATLYELCAGRPPYEHDRPLRVLTRIAVEDPPRLREIVADVPEQLEAITMKCLARDPALRYETALALSEDLRHFLESKNQPSVAQDKPTSRVTRASWLGSLVVMAVLSVLLVGATVLVERRRAAAAAAIERELAEEAVAVELFMRNAYQMPLHDIERERAVVRERIARIERRIGEVNGIARGPAEYALGRGRLALGELEAARAHLERALEVGYSPPELGYALGKLLLQLYDQGQQEAERIQDTAAKTTRLAELENAYRKPALAHLRAAVPARIEAPAYAEALLALHEARYDEAMAKAREAFEVSPLLYEAKRLEGDVRLALATQEKNEVQRSRHIEEAAAAYRTAEDIGRSDPYLLGRSCYLWTHAMFASSYRSLPTRPHFERGRESCERAVRADRMSGPAKLARAELLVLHTYALANNPEPGEDPTALIREAIDAAEAVMATGYAPVRAKEALANALRAQIIVAADHQRDGIDAAERVTRLYEELLRDFPERRAAWNASLARVYILRAQFERWKGREIGKTVERGLRVVQESLANPAGLAMMYHKQSALHMEHAFQLLQSGKSPMEPVIDALAAIEEGRKQNPNWIGFFQVEVNVRSTQAGHEIAAGLDPRDNLSKMARAAEAIAASAPNDPMSRDGLIEVAIRKAEYALRERLDPAPVIERARQMLKEAIAAGPWILAFRVALARVELLAARDAAARGNAKRAHFNAVRAALGPWLDEERADPEGRRLLEQAHRLAEVCGAGDRVTCARVARAQK